MAVLDLLTKRKNQNEKAAAAARQEALDRRDRLRTAVAEHVDGGRPDGKLIEEFFGDEPDPVSVFEQACDSYRRCTTHHAAQIEIDRLTAEACEARARSRELTASITPVNRSEGSRSWTDYPPLVEKRLSATRTLEETSGRYTDTLEEHLALLDARHAIDRISTEVNWLGRLDHRLRGQAGHQKRIRDEADAQFDAESKLAAPLNFRLP